MENASKALIMAGAILVAMAIISLSVFVFVNWKGKVTETTKMDEQKVSSVNNKILPYVGEHISGTQVNSLIQKVFALNQSGETPFIQIQGLAGNLFNADGSWATGVNKKVPTGVAYNVGVEYDNGFISLITITQ